jgi:hypothetical protein
MNCFKKIVLYVLLFGLLGTNNIYLYPTTNPTFGKKIENCNFIIFTSENSTTITSLQEAIIEANRGKTWIPTIHWHYGIYTGVIVYSYIFTKMLATAHTIRHSSFWTFWNKEIPISLITEKECWSAVEQHYNPTGLKHRIIIYQEAMNDIDREYYHLMVLATIHKRLRTLRLYWLFPRQTIIMKETTEGLQRLTVLKILLTTGVFNSIAKN